MIPNVTVVVKLRYVGSDTVSFLTELYREGFEDIVVITTDIDEKSKKEIENLKEIIPIYLVVSANQKEDDLLKDTLEYIEESREDVVGVVIADGNHGYSVSDLVTVACELKNSPDKLVIGYQKSKNAEYRFINNIHSVFLGIKVPDAMTDIKAIPLSYITTIKDTRGIGAEYNTRLYLAMKKNGIEYVSVPLESDCKEDKKIGFFKTLKIAWLVFKRVVTFLISSLAATIVDISLFNVVLFFTKGLLSKRGSIFFSSIVARVFSSLFNYTINRKTVFASDESVKKSIKRYYILAVAQMFVSSCLVTGLTTIFKAQNQGLVTLIKMIVDTILFFISFNIQEKWVFKKKG